MEKMVNLEWPNGHRGACRESMALRMSKKPGGPKIVKVTVQEPQKRVRRTNAEIKAEKAGVE